ncbi:unnamed protein product [Auanema sp. JU1783]|nr:unnamed protein product [Auanema sp. JU1783]
MNFKSCVVVPEYALIGNEILKNVAITVNENGKITEIAPFSENAVVGNEVLVPGFVNAHSHAFHRHLRGRSEIGGKTAETFWKWRDNMYGLVDGVTKEKLYEYCHQTFLEMLSAGITTVGEFHYVHHSVNGRFDLDSAVIEAAQDVGIRLALIQTLYERAGFDNGPIHPVQKNFISSYDEFIENMDKLTKQVTQPTVSLAVAAHSARGVSLESIQKLFKYSEQKNMAFHIHLEEQPKEIDDCLSILKLNKTPSDLLLEQLNLGKTFTSVHSTYTTPSNIGKFAERGCNLCICPLTEGYLGDGFPYLLPNLPICFGTDCNNRICFLEEMRWACYTQQMKFNSRSVVGLSASKLLEAATVGGARSLCLEEKVGKIEVGMQFDVVSFDLTSPTLKNCQKTDELIDSIVFGCGNREIKRVVVNGYQNSSIKYSS